MFAFSTFFSVYTREWHKSLIFGRSKKIGGAKRVTMTKIMASLFVNIYLVKAKYHEKIWNSSFRKFWNGKMLSYKVTGSRENYFLFYNLHQSRFLPSWILIIGKIKAEIYGKIVSFHWLTF